MAIAKRFALTKEMVVDWVAFTALAGAIFIAPMFHNQFFTGPLVNAALFISVYFLGLKDALLLGAIPSLIAYFVGLLPAPLGPMIPYIIISNFILVTIFHYLREKNYWLAMFTASFLKYIFLYATSYVLIDFVAKGAQAKTVASMMSWPQFATAVAGGFLAFVFLKWLKRI